MNIKKLQVENKMINFYNISGYHKMSIVYEDIMKEISKPTINGNSTSGGNSHKKRKYI